MDSGLLNPFEISEVEKFDYTFVSRDGIKYRVFFSPLQEYYPQLLNTYSFSIEPEDRTPHPLDRRIAATVVTILERFFETDENAMIMVCDTLDGKERKRRKLFDRWFKMFNNGRLIKMDAAGSVGEYELFLSIYFTKNNPNKEQLKVAFRDLLAHDLFELVI